MVVMVAMMSNGGDVDKSDNGDDGDEGHGDKRGIIGMAMRTATRDRSDSCDNHLTRIMFAFHHIMSSMVTATSPPLDRGLHI